MSNEDKSILDDAGQMLQAIAENHDLFTKMINCLPYPAQVYSPDGTLIMINPAFLEEFNVPDSSLIIGKSNILQDYTAVGHDVVHNVLAAFEGNVTCTNDVKVPVHIIKKSYNIPAKDIEEYYLDISAFPLKSDSGKILCVVVVLIVRRKMVDTIEIAKAKAYIEAHWQNEFHADKVAGAVFLSPAHFARMFKNQTGMTPHDYYINVKISKVKDKLQDLSLSIEEAFAQCGIHYHGHYAELFKKKTGLTPSDYRKSTQK
ncbi:MAG TPA: AraC family transcriptional regulator [Bacillota bacterium]|jgi:AraC family transcriptional regulator|nr:AraC family transcriptional regulator [Bacillota bacterium]HRU40493.1 AraC family transcriptional regulator [Candidatus Diapherotrites archaeon]HOS69182.1 AraC family transcriptional regulator [Bacillota bacterium]HPW41354.1 AraC family transcriptional regulator [Bacillota bacterium]HQE65848.1 AraC family transcriptional regulator [Bacillota bacterium]